MKKHLLTLILLITSTITFAQNLTYGFKFGINGSTQHVNSAGFAFNSKLLTGFNLGGIVDITNDNLTIQPGLFLTTKGERFYDNLVDANNNDAGSTTSKYILTYVEVPVNILYKTSLVPGADLHFGGGPYLAYGIAAKLSRDGVDYHGSFGNNPSDAVYYKNPDYGINFIAGAVLQNNYLVDLQYGLGLGNLAYGGGSLNNRVVSLSVGYLFR